MLTLHDVATIIMPTLQRSEREGKEFVQDYEDSEWDLGSNSGLPDTFALNYHPLLPSCY